ncbi:MAG TPA: D-2-hydroxyacid dehydrogenase [Luteitalea sp.]|nr:D-2-hydroxyacid dehydrogenase [Luteitalea sp.]
MAGVSSVRVSGVVMALAIGVAAPAARAQAPAAPSNLDAQTTRMVAELGLREGETPASALPGWKKPTRVLVRDLPDDRRAWLQEVAPGVELVAASSVSDARGRAADVDVVLGFCEPAVLDAATQARWVQTYNAGIERCLVSPVIRQRGLLLTNMQRIAGPVMAEHVMALALAFSRGLPGYLASQRDGRWSRDSLPANWSPFTAAANGSQSAFALTGKTMLVVGFGGIGTEVARRAHAFGMTVTAIRNSKAEPPPFVSRMGLPGDLATFVRDADIVVDTLPLTPDTRNMFDAKIFGAMKKTAFFVNVGRGGTVNTDDLVQALVNRTIAGAGLDVVEPEPLPDGHPLWKAPGLILTPHVSADSDIDEDVRWLLVRENLRRYVAGGKLLSVVDTTRGY